MNFVYISFPSSLLPSPSCLLRSLSIPPDCHPSASLSLLHYYLSLSLSRSRMYTPGCHSNRRRPHEAVDEQKSQLACFPPWRERKRGREWMMEMEDNQLSFFIGEGFWCVWKNLEEYLVREVGGRGGWMVWVKQVHKWNKEKEKEEKNYEEIGKVKTKSLKQ